MIGIPYQQGLNDIRVIFQGGHTPKDWYQMVCDQFDTLYAEGATQSRVMTIPSTLLLSALRFASNTSTWRLIISVRTMGFGKRRVPRSQTTFTYTVTRNHNSRRS